MSKPITRFMLCSFLTLFLSVPSKAAEYDLTGQHCYHGKFNLLARGEGDYSLSYVLHGAPTYDDDNLPFGHMATRCVGLFSLRGDKTDSHAHCEFIDKDGDKLFTIAAARGSENIGTLPRGTGKFEGVTGTFTSQPVGSFPNPEDGNFVGCRKHQHTFTLPD